MEFRKIIAFGKSSFVVSLPKDWLKTNTLGKGDVVFLEQKGDTLEVHPREKGNEEREERKAYIEVDGKSIKRLRREISAAFIDYNDVIVLQGKTLPKVSAEVIKVMHGLIALEIMEQSHQKIVAKDFLRAREVNVSDYLRKADLTVRSMFQDLKSEEFLDFDDVMHRQSGINRVHLLLLKVFKRMITDPIFERELSDQKFEFIKFSRFNYGVQYIGLALFEIAGYMKELNSQEMGTARELVGKLEEDYLLLMKSFYKNDKEKAYDFSERRDSMLSGLQSKTFKDPNLWRVWSNILYIHKELHEMAHQIYD